MTELLKIMTKKKHALPFVIFNEELNTLFDGLKYYAQEVETETYPRAIALYAGDVFTTNNYSIIRNYFVC